MFLRSHHIDLHADYDKIIRLITFLAWLSCNFNTKGFQVLDFGVMNQPFFA